MSTKADKYGNHNLRIYEEVSEEQFVLGKHVGYNLYIQIDADILHNIVIEDGFIFLEVVKDNILPAKMKIWGADVVYTSMDRHGALIGIKGGTSLAKDILSQNFESITLNQTK